MNNLNKVVKNVYVVEFLMGPIFYGDFVMADSEEEVEEIIVQKYGENVEILQVYLDEEF